MFDVCRVAHIKHIRLSNFFFQFSYGCEQFHYGRSFGFLVINVCIHGEHYETPCILIHHFTFYIEWIIMIMQDSSVTIGTSLWVQQCEV
jgi:hypothetical protein